MPRLIVNPGTTSERVISLSRGVTTLGRHTENHHALDDPSVSGAHFQVSVTNSGTIVRDLGSTNGTFVDGNRVEEVILLPGQTLTAGEVSMRFEADYEMEPAPTKAAKPAALETGVCHTHLEKVAQFLCPQCKRLLCERCVTSKVVRGRTKRQCLVCREECLELNPSAATPREKVPFAKQIPGAFMYPLQGDGLILLAGGAVFFGVLGFVASMASIVGLVLRFFLAAYLVVYAREILRSSANGEEQMPPWPDIERISEYRAPFFEFYGTMLLWFLPAIAIGFLHSSTAPMHAIYLGSAMVICGLFVPMALTAVTMFDSISAANPLLVIPSILKIPVQYLLAVVVMLVGFAASAAIEWALRKLPIPILPSLVAGVLQIYLVALVMRLCGLLYRAEEKTLGWF